MNQQFIEGEAVFDTDGDKVGQIHEYNAQEGYIVVQKGWLFPKDLYVPVNAIARNDAEGVYLNLHKDDLEQHAYDEPPVGGFGAAATATSATATSATATTQVVDSAVTNTVVETGDDIRVPVLEEELVASKRREELGRVRIHKDVVSEQQTVSMPVTHEEVYVERVPLQGQYMGAAADAFTDKYIDITIMGEQLVASKRATVAEEVRVHKDVTMEQQDITDTVRRERVVVDGVDQLQGADATTATNTAGYRTTSNS